MGLYFKRKLFIIETTCKFNCM